MSQEVDPELLVIFHEEASELTQAFDECIAQWNADQNNPEPIREIRRLIHTLKGSAKMVKFSNLADFCHRLEEVLIGLGTGGLALTPAIQDIIAASQTVLHTAVNVILQNRDVPIDSTIIKNLESVNNISDKPQKKSLLNNAPINNGPIHNTVVKAQDKIKLSVETMEKFSQLAANTSIARAHLEQQHHRVINTMEILKDQIEMLQEKGSYAEPMEELVETTNKINSILSAQTEVLREQKQDTYFLEDSLTRARMVSFAYLIPRLEALVKQTAKELNKQVDFQVTQMLGEMDRSVLEKLMPSFEHLLRNAIDHGIEPPDVRSVHAKPPIGKITLSFIRKGAWVVIKIADDGRGLDRDKIRAKAIKLGYLKPEVVLSDREMYSYILMPGFSTKETVTQISGRGIGLDIVDSELKKLGGNIVIKSVANQETIFSLRIPLSLSLNKVLIFTLGDQLFGILLSNIQGATRLPYATVQKQLSEKTIIEYAQERYNIHYIGEILRKISFAKIEEPPSHYMPVLLIKTEEYAGAFIIDKIIGIQEVVVKTLGRQLLGMRELLGASIIGEGDIVLVLDSYELIQKQIQNNNINIKNIENKKNIALYPIIETPSKIEVSPLTILLVDDSATIRKATKALLEQNNPYDTIREALDGVDALQSMADVVPDVVLLDLDMPHMGGLEVIDHMKVSEFLMHVPIIVLSAASSLDIKQKVLDKGADAFFAKPVNPQALFGARALYRQQSPRPAPDLH